MNKEDEYIEREEVSYGSKIKSTLGFVFASLILLNCSFT